MKRARFGGLRAPAVLTVVIVSSVLSANGLFAQTRLVAKARPGENDKPAASLKTNPGERPFTTGSTDPFLPVIDAAIRQGWAENEVTPSAPADDYEWFRRVHLDIVGHIPRGEEVEPFVVDKDDRKRAKLVDKLLDDPAYAAHWMTVWTNLCIGRRTPERVNRDAMQKFFRESFTTNRPWNEIVVALLVAEGRFDEVGAVNYLLAQMTMNDEGVQATAKTSQLFMGMQLQCTQCHDHPFVNDWKQKQFWEINSFFRQARRINHRKLDPDTGRMVDDYSELVNEEFNGPVFYERRNGEMQVAYPTFFNERIEIKDATNRRAELARLITQGEPPLLARAMVNRMWSRFFGYGFTNPVDDMGPHRSPSHPELLDDMAREFARQGYDVRKLIRWIANSEAYNLTSRFGKKNSSDDPEGGQMPLFSRVYLKSMEAEQLYDSLLIATEADKAGKGEQADAGRQRDEWLRQFIITFGTDDNGEATTFNGTIPQALMMMNGPMIETAISAEQGSYLHRVISTDEPDVKKLQRLYLAALGRRATPRELNVANKIVQATGDRFAAFQDVFWAVLNSNEFVINH
ncbi:MAG: DUF1549 and DUF1553 domain-containing protein [Planctomycetaceae bacterium]